MDFGIFSERLKDLIFDTGKTPRDVAHDIGISKTSLYEYLSGYKTPTLNNLIKIANFFNCSCDYLFGFEDFAENEVFTEVKPFHIRFQEVLKHLDISRYKLEKLTGISESVLYYWAKGDKIPSVERIVHVAKVLNVSVDFIIGRRTLP